MAIPSGLSAQLGIAEEITYGTPETVTRFYEFNNESLALSIERLESAGLRAGTRVLRSDRWSAGQRSVDGSVEMEVHDRSMGLWFLHALGAVQITTPGGATLTRDHTHTPGDLPVGLTVQVGRTDEGGTTRAFTYHGCRIASWELGAAVGEIAHFTPTIVGEDEDTATALASASYATSSLLTFVQGTLQIAAANVDVRSAMIRGDNGLGTDRYRLGSALRKQPLEASMREYGGDLDAYFTDLTAYNRFVNGTEAALELLFQGDVIEGAFNFEVKVTCNVRFDGETPQVGGAEEIPQPLAFKCVDDGSGPGSAITLVYRTTDTAS